MPIEGPKIAYKPGDDIPSNFRRVVEERAEQTAFIFKDRRVKWGELGGRVSRVANKLLSMGAGKGERVDILSRNSVEYVEAYFGALAAGACAVPLPSMASSDALELMIRDSAPKALFVSAQLREMVEPFINELDKGLDKGLKPLALTEEGRVGLDFGGDGWVDYDRWMEGASEDWPGVEIGPKDEFHIIYSSGTTGTPKGIKHSHANRVAFVEAFNAMFARPGTVNFISTPLYSHTTMVTWLPSMRNGATCVMMDKFDAREFLRLCEAERATIAMLVPAQYERILRVEDFDGFDLSSMAVKLCTSAPLHPDTKRKILDRMPGALVEFYGLTEGGVNTVLVANRFPDKLDSVGVAGPGCEIKIIGEDGNELPRGRTGEIVGRNAIIMSGYHNRDRDTDDALWFDGDGRAFMRSGDMGRMDEDGFVYVSGRKKEVIISGGFNIFAIDLETELLKHDAVLEAAVIGVPSDKWGETPLALAVMDDKAEETPDSLLEWVNARLGKNQRISKIEFRDELPKSQIGKILKKELRKPYWSD